jgi:DHA2 family multidrug resistance protein-like MFS transporter
MDGLLADAAPDVVARARETVSGATAAAVDLPVAEGSRVVHAAHEAFTGSMHLVGAVAAVVFVVMAVATSRIRTA